MSIFLIRLTELEDACEARGLEPTVTFRVNRSWPLEQQWECFLEGHPDLFAEADAGLTAMERLTRRILASDRSDAGDATPSAAADARAERQPASGPAAEGTKT